LRLVTTKNINCPSRGGLLNEKGNLDFGLHVKVSRGRFLFPRWEIRSNFRLSVRSLVAPDLFAKIIQELLF
jgi:hypothetical protein